ncbi:MAG TPA: chemotaxis protein CheB [Thermoanaerobaculia bacterium]|nr:chemotaxis protein CheB [Thermoanaerobaculia bacterium]
MSLHLVGDTMLRELERPSHVVALAASAGGLAAVSQILSGLPADFPAPILVVQHLDPHHRSWLAEILTRRTGLRVLQVRGGEQLAAGTVFLAPPGQHLLVTADGTLSLSDTARVQFVRPSADVLFGSLAESWDSGAIAVVLTGTGKDGADGVRAVKGRGGTVIVQDEASAEFFGMPNAAIQTGTANQILPLDAIAAALMELTAGEIA